MKKSTRKKLETKAASGQLDRFGTSQKQASKGVFFGSDTPNRDNLDAEYVKLTDQAKLQKCVKDAPLICIPPQNGEPAKIFQGTCNSWNCPRCGLFRAATEYARICEGIKNLQKQGFKLFFLTITVKGQVTSADAERQYLEDTNRLLSVLRASAKRTDQHWCYVQVTERQKRQHPHSHLITTYCPPDAFYISEDYSRYVKEVARINRWLPMEMRFSPKKPNKVYEGEMFSRYLIMRAVKAGLGAQCNISRVRSPSGAARYMAKYLFKAAQSTKWPKGWKRIRYSQNWDKLPEPEDTGAFAVLTNVEWDVVRSYKVIVTDDANVFEKCRKHFVLGVFITVEGEIFDKLE